MPCSYFILEIVGSGHIPRPVLIIQPYEGAEGRQFVCMQRESELCVGFCPRFYGSVTGYFSCSHQRSFQTRHSNLSLSWNLCRTVLSLVVFTLNHAEKVYKKRYLKIGFKDRRRFVPSL